MSEDRYVLINQSNPNTTQESGYESGNSNSNNESLCRKSPQYYAALAGLSLQNAFDVGYTDELINANAMKWGILESLRHPRKSEVQGGVRSMFLMKIQLNFGLYCNMVIVGIIAIRAKCRNLDITLATLSALAAGTVLGWTSPILSDLKSGHYQGIPLNDDQIGWVGSFATLGGMSMCIPTGFLCDLIGRKKALLLLIIPFTSGWLLIIFANNVVMLYFGRLITGMAAGACCVAVPLYTSEIAHKSLRGTLGSFFQLMITIGILFAYIFGKYFSPVHFTIICASVPIAFVFLFAFQPETPVFLLKRGKYDEARISMSKLRGKKYVIDTELNEIEGHLKESDQVTVSLRETLSQGYVMKAIVVSFSLMFFQQFSGVNAVILYTSEIFKSSGVNLDTRTASIIVGAFQVVATLIATIVIDKLGRKFLLLVSAFFVTITTFLLAVYFTLKYRTDMEESILQQLSWLPIGALCVFIIAFSLGLGPIPWVISAEIFPTEIKSIATSTAGTMNWLLAFILTKFFLQVSDYIGNDSIFYIFSFASMVAVLFIQIFVPETKGKSLVEIQADINH